MNCASVSPGNPTITSVWMATSGMRARILSHEPAVAVDGVAAPHVRQHLVVAGLDRDFDAGTDFFNGRHGFKKLVREPVGVAGQKANARDAVHTGHFSQEIGQVGAVVEIHAVAVHDLAEERDVLHAFRGQFPHFPKNVVFRPASLAAAPGGNHAVGAGVGTAEHDRNIGGHGFAELGQRKAVTAGRIRQFPFK